MKDFDAAGVAVYALSYDEAEALRDFGEALPDVRCSTADAAPFDLHTHRAGRPAVLVFYRSSVW